MFLYIFVSILKMAKETVVNYLLIFYLRITWYNMKSYYYQAASGEYPKFRVQFFYLLFQC